MQGGLLRVQKQDDGRIWFEALDDGGLPLPGLWCVNQQSELSLKLSDLIDLMFLPGKLEQRGHLLIKHGNVVLKPRDGGQPLNLSELLAPFNDHDVEITVSRQEPI